MRARRSLIHRKKRNRIIGIAVASLILLLLLWWGFYQLMMNQTWKLDHQAIDQALRKTQMAQADHVEHFAGAQAYRIVFGRDKQGKEMIVWVSPDDIHAEYAADGVKRKQVKNSLMQRHPDGRIVRVTPGKLDDQYVWEVYYTAPEQKGVRSYYDYYRFSDGSLLDTYTLRLED